MIGPGGDGKTRCGADEVVEPVETNFLSSSAPLKSFFATEFFLPAMQVHQF